MYTHINIDVNFIHHFIAFICTCSVPTYAHVTPQMAYLTTTPYPLRQRDLPGMASCPYHWPFTIDTSLVGGYPYETY